MWEASFFIFDGDTKVKFDSENTYEGRIKSSLEHLRLQGYVFNLLSWNLIGELILLLLYLYGDTC